MTMSFSSSTSPAAVSECAPDRRPRTRRGRDSRPVRPAGRCISSHITDQQLLLDAHVIDQELIELGRQLSHPFVDLSLETGIAPRVLDPDVGQSPQIFVCLCIVLQLLERPIIGSRLRPLIKLALFSALPA